MLEYDRTDISEEIDINKSSDKSKECNICHYWYFLDKNFNYEPHLCANLCDLMQKAIHFCSYMSKDDAISIIHNANLIDKKGVL